MSLLLRQRLSCVARHHTSSSVLLLSQSTRCFNTTTAHSAEAAVAASASSSSSASAPLPLPSIRSSSNRVNYTLPKVKKGADTSKQRATYYQLEQGLALSKALATASFNETISISIKLNLDPRKPNQSVRGAASLPHGTGKQVRVAVFAKGEKAQEAKAAGADIVGDQSLVDAINAGKIEFDRCIATPDMMSFVGRVARVLGPRGLMPNPKVGTVTTDVMTAVKASKMGSVEFKTDKMGVVAVPVGKADFTVQALQGNIEAFVEKLIDLKPSGASKGAYILASHVVSTQGPGIPLDIKSSPFGKANSTSTSTSAIGDTASATVLSGRYGRMHSLNGFNVIRYDLGAHPSAEKLKTSKGKWPQVIQTIRQARKRKDGWKEVLDKVEQINTSAPLPEPKKPAAATAQQKK